MIRSMSDLTAVSGHAGAGQPAAVDAAWVVLRAGELLAGGRARSAREIVREALDTFGRRSDLLWVLADVEFADGDFLAGRECMAEALAATPSKPGSVARQIRVLRGNGFWREALSAVQAVPADMRGDPLVWAEAGIFYRACGCPAHAAGSYGPRRSLPFPARATRRWCWLRSGGPAGRLRRKAYAWEEMVLQDLSHPPGYIGSISGVKGVDAPLAQRVQSQLETYAYRYTRLSCGWLAMNRAGYRLIPLAVVPVWLVLLAVVSLAGITQGHTDVLSFTAVSAVVATIPAIAVVLVMLKPSGHYRHVVSRRTLIAFFFAVVVAEAVAGDGYARHLLPAGGWQAAVVLGLIASPATVACLPIADALAYAPFAHRARQIARRDSLLPVLAWLLSVLHDLRSSRDNRGVPQRLDHCRYLEFAARRLAQDILPASSISFLGSNDWLTRRTAGWAEAIRQMQRQVIASVPGGEGKLQALLAHEIRCLATGDLGALAWREPPLPPSRRATLQRQAISTVRALVVAVLPIAAVLATQPFLHASPGLFGWARITTGIWALLYVLLSIDPAIRDKIGAARDLADLIHTAPAPPGHDDQR